MSLIRRSYVLLHHYSQAHRTYAVQVHFDKTTEGDNGFTTTAQARKLMHRFSEAEVEKAMDEVNAQ